MVSAHPRAGTIETIGTRSWKIHISSAGECFQANDSQVRDFYTRAITMAISVQNPMLKVNLFL